MVAEGSNFTEQLVKFAGESIQPLSNRASVNAEKRSELTAKPIPSGLESCGRPFEGRPFSFGPWVLVTKAQKVPRSRCSGTRQISTRICAGRGKFSEHVGR